MPTKSAPRTCNGNGLIVTLSLKKPWWWTAALTLSALPMIVTYAVTGVEPSEAKQDAFVAKWAARLVKHGTVVVG